MKYAKSAMLNLVFFCFCSAFLCGQSVKEFIEQKRFDRGIAVCADMENYLICVVLNQGKNGVNEVYSAIWKDAGEPKKELEMSKSQSNEIICFMLSIQSTPMLFSLDGPSLVMHGETIEIISRRGMFESVYSESLDQLPCRVTVLAMLHALKKIAIGNGIKIK